eukprot:scaffold3402_cov169-Amphora_coffeaeformis.AAC.9
MSSHEPANPSLRSKPPLTDLRMSSKEERAKTLLSLNNDAQEHTSMVPTPTSSSFKPTGSFKRIRAPPEFVWYGCVTHSHDNVELVQ